MTPVPTDPLPGSMTVPPLFGWENILIVLLVLITVAVAFFVTSAFGTGADHRGEWQDGLAARSRQREGLNPPPADPPPAEPTWSDPAPVRTAPRGVGTS